MQYLTAILMGYVTYSVGQYFIHRRWHIEIKNSEDPNKSRIDTFHEFMHHFHYGQRPPVSDEKREYIKFPVPIAVGIDIFFFGIYFLISRNLASSFIAAMIPMLLIAIDSWAHRKCHLTEPKSKLLKYLQRRHDLHHATWDCNYTFLSAIWFEKLMGTNKGE